MQRQLSPRLLFVHITLLVIILGVAWPAPATMAEEAALAATLPSYDTPPAGEDTPSLTHPVVMDFQPGLGANRLADFAPAGTQMVTPAQDGSGFPAMCTYQVQGTNGNPFAGFEYQAVGANKLENGMFDDLTFEVPLSLLSGIDELPVYAKANGFQTSAGLTLGSCDVQGVASCSPVTDNGFSFTFMGSVPVGDDTVQMTLRVQNDNEATLSKVVVGIPDLYPYNPAFEQTSEACTGPSRAGVPGPGQNGINSFRGGQVAVVTEGETFTEEVDLEFVPLFVPEQDGMIAASSLPVVKFRMEALNRGNGQVQAFNRPARLVIDMRAALAELGDINEVYSQFYLQYREVEGEGPWQMVPFRKHQNGLISAEVTHFSEWEAGVRPERWAPAWNPPAVSQFSGAATYSHGIQVPPGRNGMQPQVSLSYSSRGLDGHIYSLDSGALPPGWSMAEISIVRSGVKMERRSEPENTPYTLHPEKFRLVLNGTGHELVQDPAYSSTDDIVRYYAKDGAGLRVTRFFNETMAQNADKLFWVVETGDGMVYRLGYTADAEIYQEVMSSNNIQIDGHQGIPNNGISAIAWHVDTIVDTAGNQISYYYNNGIVGEEFMWVDGDDNRYITIIGTEKNRIERIDYNYPNIHSPIPANPYTMVRPTDNQINPGSRIWFVNSNLEATGGVTNIYTFHGGEMVDPQREYRLEWGGYDEPSTQCKDANENVMRTKTDTINSIREWTGTNNDPTDVDAGYALPETSFEYSLHSHLQEGGKNCYIFPYLTSYNNGYGGTVSFSYTSDERSAGGFAEYDGGDLVYEPHPDIGYSYFVSEMRVSDGINADVVTTYEPSTPCYGQFNSDDVYNHDWGIFTAHAAIRCPSNDSSEFGALVGFGTNIKRQLPFDSSVPLNSSVTDYHQFGESLGKVNTSQLWAGEVVLGTLLEVTSNSYQSFSLGATHFNVLVETEKEVRDGSGRTMTSRIRYGYDIALQNNAQYGNRTVVFDEGNLDDVNDNRTTIRCYLPNDSGPTGEGRWLVNYANLTRVFSGILPAGDIRDDLCRRDYSGSHEILTSSYNYYDGGVRFPTILTQGRLTQTEVGFSGAVLPNGNDYMVTGQMEYDLFGNATKVINGAGAEQTVAYDGYYNLYPVQVSNELGHTSYFDIIGFEDATGGGVVTATDLAGAEQLAGLARSITGPTGSSILYEYDPFGRLWASYEGSATAAPDNGIDSDRTDGNPTMKYRYWDNSWNSNFQYRNPSGGNPFMISTESYPGYLTGNERTHVYEFFDGLGRTIQTNTPWSKITDGIVDEEVLRDVVVKTSYNVLGQVACTSMPYDVAIAGWPYAQFDTTVECTDSSLDQTLMTYDQRGRTIAVTEPNGEVTTTSYQIKSTEIAGVDSDYYMTQVVDALGRITNSLRDSRGQLVSVRELMGTGTANDPYSHYVWVEYAYDQLGNLTEVTTHEPDDNNGNPGEILRRTTMEYDSLGNKIGMNDPDMGIWDYGYDVLGNMVAQRDATEQTICFDYDSLNRLMRKSIGDSNPRTNGQQAEPQPETVKLGCDGSPSMSWGTLLATYSYYTSGYGLGQPYQIQWGADDLDTFVYDAYGRMKRQTRTLDGRDYVMETVAYDDAQRPITMKYPDDQRVHIEYDREGPDHLSISNGVDSTDLVTDIAYNLRGQMTHLVRAGNAVDTAYEYKTVIDNFRLAKIINGTETDTLPDFFYNYDAVGNITVKRTNFGLFQYDTESYVYDDLDRLVQAYGLVTGTLVPFDHYHRQYEYDLLGNLTERREYDPSDLADTYTFDYDNGTVQDKPDAVDEVRVNGVLKASMTYDDNGNMTVREAVDGTVYDQVFDVQNRLTTVTVGGTGETTYFYYDHMGQRTAVVDPAENKTIYYPFPGYEEEVVTTCVIKNWQQYCSDMVTGRKSTYSVAGLMIAQNVEGEGSDDGLYFFHTDHLGSASALTDMNGNLVAGSMAHYLPYGEERFSPTTTLSDYGFTGHKENRDLGLTYMNFRYYVPELGRFNKADTIVPDPGKAVGYNRYAYVNNNPIRYNDPTGHKLEEGIEDNADGSCFDGSTHHHNCIYPENHENAGHYIRRPGSDAAIAANRGTALNMSAMAPFVGTIDDGYTLFFGCGIACQRGYDEPVSWRWRLLAGGALVLPISVQGMRMGAGYLDEVADLGGNVIRGFCSFSADTLVATEDGMVPISEVDSGTLVLAYDEEIDEIGYHPVTDVWAHQDTIIVHLVIDGEMIETTPEHPFYVGEGEWVAAGELVVGDEINRANGETGAVDTIRFMIDPQPMYNFTVDVAHTYFVGDGEWLVHNDCELPSITFNSRQYAQKLRKHAPEFNLDVTNATDREKFYNLIMDVRDNYTHAKQGKWHEYDNAYFFRNKDDMLVVTQSNGQFITMFRNASQNGWYQNAASLNK